jgi:membrane protease YdiL (CAAX protease family)
MAESADLPEPLLPPVVEPVKKGHPVIAWIVIGVLAGLIVVGANLQPASVNGEPDDSLALTIMQLQARMIIGASQLGSGHGEILKQLKQLAEGSIGQRLRYAIVIGELVNPEEAFDQLRRLDEDIAEKERSDPKFKPKPEDVRTRTILEHLYSDYAAGKWSAPSVTETEREYLKHELDWFGDLALAPKDGPDQELRERVMSLAFQTMVAVVGGFVLLGLAALVGLVALVVFLILLMGGNLRHLQCTSYHGGVYAETFAVWLIVFMALRIAAGRVFGEDEKLLMSGAISLLSLVALAWPVLRGIPWRQVREEIGWSRGRRPALEPVLGLGAYVLALPLAAIGLSITLVLIQIVMAKSHAGQGNEFNPSSSPSHPIIQIIVSGDWRTRLEALFLASLVAPVVEETVFRGVLYRHLREATRRLGFFVSLGTSAVLNSFIFAAIHPQGLIAVPPLMGLAIGFSLMREWRGTLIPSIIAHGLNNGLVLLLVTLAFGN